MPRAAVCHRFGEPLAIEQVTLDPPGRGRGAPADHGVRDLPLGRRLRRRRLGRGAPGRVRPRGLRRRARDRPRRGVAASRRTRRGEPGAQLRRLPRAAATAHRRCARPASGSTTARRSGLPAAAAPFRACAAAPSPTRSSCTPRRRSRSPPALPDRSACLIACAVMTGMGAATNDAGVTPGATVAVIGAGGVGLNAVQGAALAGRGAGDRGRRRRRPSSRPPPRSARPPRSTHRRPMRCSASSPRRTAPEPTP